ncbi:Carboxylesterase [Hibiscus syriacus]|uniref:Carboxylesterase n=1 Tax=Hibiscus syriacus TaxID=106335 RepID=A0A6A3BDI5_HIBSY|nr:Carboxylesterase [Hibiscus syriacus]
MNRRATVHPSPSITADQLCILPPTIVNLASALSLEEKQVLDYLISRTYQATVRTTPPKYKLKEASAATTTMIIPLFSPTIVSDEVARSKKESKREFEVMKKLYCRATVHLSPLITLDHLCILPPTIETLVAAFSRRKNKSWFISSLAPSTISTSSLVNWDSSPNRKMIHEIIDVFKDMVARSKKTERKRRRKDNSAHNRSVGLKEPEEDSGELNTVEPSNGSGDGGTVHQSPTINVGQLCILPPTIVTLAKPPCYMSYWGKWDSSPNRQLIHEIIDVFEDELARSKKTKSKSKKEKKTKAGSADNSSVDLNSSFHQPFNDFDNFSSHRKNNTPKIQAKRSFGHGSDNDHPPLFTCDCFNCYMSYWGKCDSSPNRQLIHEIIDAFEDELARSKKTNSKKERKTKGGYDDSSVDLNSILPPTIVTLSVALSLEEKQVLAYLISRSINDFDNLSSHRKNNTPKIPTKRSFGHDSDNDHPPLFTCDCFNCYMSYWGK